MPAELSPLVPPDAPCKACGSRATLFGVVDFNRDCNVASGKIAPLAGVPIYYHRCGACGLIFTVAFDAWSSEDFATHVYNRDYAAIDPDYLEKRPAGNAQLIAHTFPDTRPLRVLDYGGGNGRLAQLLRGSGFTHAVTYDPFVAEFAHKPAGKFDLIVCFEVVEHTPTPRATFDEMRSMLADDGLIFFSTLLQPNQIDQLGTSWWYIAPRNGHVTLYTPQALAALAQPDLTTASAGELLHVMFRRSPPAFARHLFAAPST